MTELPIVVNMTVDASRTEYDLTAESNLEEIELLNDTVIETGGSHYPVYEGPYTVDAGLTAVSLDTDGKRMTQDVTVNALQAISPSSPSISVDNDNGRITATATYPIGYNDTMFVIPTVKPLQTQGAHTYTPSNTEQTILTKGTFITGNIKVGAIPTGTRGTPTATKGTVSNHSVSVTPSVTNTTGYITGGTINGTAVSVSASELVSGSLSITTNNTYDVTNYASAVVNVAGVSGYTITNNLTNITTNNASTEVGANQPYYAVLTVTSGYTFQNCTVTMGNADITLTAFNESDMSITISSVTGNVVITANASSLVIVYTQGSIGGNNTNSNVVTGVITTPLHFDTETLTINVPSGYRLYPFGLNANSDETKVGTRSGSNILYGYVVSDSGYIPTNNSNWSGTLTANGTNIKGSGSGGWKTGETTVTWAYGKSSQYGCTIKGIAFLFGHTDTTINITPAEVPNIITVTYNQSVNANQVLNVLLGGETV